MATIIGEFYCVWRRAVRTLGVTGIIVLLAAAVPLLLFLRRPQNRVSAVWYNEAWKYRKLFVVDDAKVSGSTSLTNFPILVSRTDTDLSAKAQADGDDIVFTDSSGTKLDYELERYTSATGELFAWVKIPTLNATGPTALYMYYGNAAAVNQENISGVWDSNYVAVYHFAEGSTPYLDSTANNNDSTSDNVTSRTATGIAGYAPDFEDTSNNIVVVNDSGSLDINANTLTVEAWIEAESLVTTNLAHRFLYCKRDSTNGFQPYCLGTEGNGSNAFMYFYIYDSGGNMYEARSNAALTAATDYYFAGVLQGQSQNLLTYHNGALSANYTNSFGAAANLKTTNNALEIGRGEEGTGLDFDGILDEVRISNVNRSADWIATTYETIRNNSTFFSTAGSEEPIPDPVSYWRLDEGTGTSVNDDAPGSDNTLTITGAAWASEDLCVAGKCLYFDGSGDTASIVDANITASLDVANGGSFTLQGWFRKTGAFGAGVQDLVQKINAGDADGGFRLQWETDGTISCKLDDADADTTIDDTVTTTASYADNKWHQVSCVLEGTSRLSLYVDGQQVTSLKPTVTQTLENDDAFTLGLRDGGTTTYYQGYIDEVRFFNFARTASQIAADYDARSAPKGVSVRFGDPDQESYLSNGLVGYWHMDDNTGTNATDSSGNGNTGAFTNTPAWGIGKFGTSVYFDPAATNKYINIPAAAPINNLSAYTFSAWVYPTATQNGTIMSKSGDVRFYLAVQSGGLRTDAYRACTGSNLTALSSSVDNLSLNTWHHLVYTWDGLGCAVANVQIYIDGQPNHMHGNSSSGSGGQTDDSSGAMRIGNSSNAADQFPGYIDEVRVYNRALPTSEIERLYAWGPGPVGWWKMDENTGTNIYDTSGNANTVIAGAGTAFQIPRWVQGKYGAGLLFDGVNDYAAMGADSDILEPVHDMTAEGWIYPTKNTTDNGGNDEYIMEKNISGGNCTASYVMFVESQAANQDALRFYWYAANATSYNSMTYASATGGIQIQKNQWQHVAAVVSGTSIKLYINGIYANQTTGTPAAADTICPGSGAASDMRFSNTNAIATFPGFMDDFKVYNYARTQGQIIEDMNGGHPSPGSPISSAFMILSFDEGYGDTSYDTGYGGNNGDLVTGSTCPGGSSACPSWTTAGYLGKALDFDGANDYLFFGASAPELDISGDISLSVWVKADTFEDGEYIIHKGETGSELEADNDLYFLRWDTTSGNDVEYGHEYGAGNDESIIFDTNLASQTWYNLTLTRNTTDNFVKLYINGNLKSQTKYINDPTGGTGGEMAIGSNDDASGNFLDGTVDEFRIYTSELTAGQVKLLYNQASSMVMGSLSTLSDGVTASNSAAVASCVPGDTTTCTPPIAEWKFEENSGLSAFDTSGNNLTLTLQNGVRFGTGKFGTGLSVNGVNQYATMGNNTLLKPTTNMTVSFWMKLYQTASSRGEDAMLVRKEHSADPWQSYQIAVRSDNNTIDVDYHTANTTSYCGNIGSTAIAANTWYHVEVVISYADQCRVYLNGKDDTAFGSTPVGSIFNSDGNFSVGAASSSSKRLNGIIDDLRIYNYTRTPAQVAWDYNRGAPLLHYAFSECQGGTAYNSALNSNGEAAGIYDGTIAIGATGNNTALGSCSGNSTDAWFNGAIGKFGSALSLDGTNDYVGTSDLTALSGLTNMSVSVWFYQHTQGGSWDEVVTDFGSGAGDAKWWMGVTNANKTLDFAIQTANCSYSSTANTRALTPPNTININTWYHAVGTYDGTTINLYLNGALSSSAKYTTGLPPSPCGGIVKVGAIMTTAVSNYFDGLIDDVWLYNYALTPAQVKTLFNENSSVRIAPAQGSP